MEHRTDSFVNAGGDQIYTQSWLPDGAARAALVINHGLGEHSGRYNNLVECLVPQRIAVYGFDLPGHGRSSGQRLYVRRLEDYVETLDAYVDRVRQAQPQAPLFVLGHSMGGLIVASFLSAVPHSRERQAKLAGAILSAPSVAEPDDVSPLVIWASKVLSVLAPRIPVAQIVDPQWLSRDPEVVRAYADDPLVSIGKITARLGAELIAGQQQVMRDAANIALPLLAIHGSEDRLVASSGTQKLYAAIRSEDKSIRIHDGLYHECMNEPECADVLDGIANWLDAHLDTPHAA